MTDPRDARIRELEAAIKRIMIGGNDLASSLIGMFRGQTMPPYGTDLAVARSAIKDIDQYDAWVCWHTIMQVRAALTPKPDAQPNPAAEPEPINYHRAVEHLSGRIETLEGALRRADDRLAAIHRAYQNGVHPRVNRLVDSLPTLIAEGEKALREEESEECPNCANPPHDGPCRRKIQKEPTC